MKRALALLVATGCAGGAAGEGAAPAGAVDPASVVTVGAARYVTGLGAGEKPPSNFHGQPVRPKVTEGFSGIPVTNDWWSSLIWQFDPGGKANPHSEVLHAHPLVLRARAAGLGLGYPRDPQVASRTYFFPYREDLLVGVEGLNAPATRVAAYDDWIVTARWEDGPRALAATIGHGLPFAYFDAAGAPPVIELPANAAVTEFAQAPGALGLTVAGRAYGLFAPRGGRWTREGARVRGALGEGGRYFSVAALPDDKPATFARFRRHAGVFVTGTRVAWQYDPASAELRTTFTFETAARDPGPGQEKVPLVALYPHQWKYLASSSGVASGAGYRSPRGTMKLLPVSRFETVHRFAGVLPVLPAPAPAGGAAAAGFDGGNLRSMLRAAARAGDAQLFPPGMDGTRGTYWTGKSLERVALLAWLAEQAGETAARQKLVAALARVLEDWFDGRAPNLFAYDRTWSTLVGLPQEYRSGWELNDHHFHYGQYVFAAATVARFDPGWAAAARFGGLVDLLIKDAANPDRGDRRFPFLRHFDAYAGHSWANGPALFPEGNNQESSSEDMNFAAAVILWGAVTGRTELRDLGIFLHAQTAAAIDQYWFDVDGDNFPDGFDRPALGMVWGGGGKYDTWWDRNPVYVHGINFLPFTGGSLYLGRRPDYVRRNYQALADAIKGPPRLWRDIIWMYLALAEPKKAIALYKENPYFEPEFGSSRAYVYHWLHTLAAHGQVDATVTADAPTYAVLNDGATRHHVAFNPTAAPLVVKFSDGVTVSLGAHEQKVVSAPAVAVTASGGR